MNDPRELIILENFIGVLEELGIAYAIGGSMASSVYGKVRFTEDADITVEPFDSVADKFFKKLKAEYYISGDAMYQALREQGSFNIIHLETAFKIDVFVCKNTVFEKQMMGRCKELRISDSLEKTFLVVSPEDIILLKLRRYRDGGCSSERQWDDVLGVLQIQAGRLDFSYLKKWAVTLNVDELLEKALSATE